MNLLRGGSSSIVALAALNILMLPRINSCGVTWKDPVGETTALRERTSQIKLLCFCRNQLEYD